MAVDGPKDQLGGHFRTGGLLLFDAEGCCPLLLACEIVDLLPSDPAGSRGYPCHPDPSSCVTRGCHPFLPSPKKKPAPDPTSIESFLFPIPRGTPVAAEGPFTPTALLAVGRYFPEEAGRRLRDHAPGFAGFPWNLIVREGVLLGGFVRRLGCLNSNVIE